MIKKKNRFFFTILAIIISIALNGILGKICINLQLPLFLDSIFTILTAALFGLWPAILIGLLTNLFLETITGFSGLYYPFALAGIITAITTALFINKKKFEIPLHAFWLIILLSVLNAITGSVIVTLLYGGFSNSPIDYIVKGMFIGGKSIISATFITRIVVNIADKGIAVILTYILYKVIHRKLLIQSS